MNRQLQGTLFRQAGVLAALQRMHVVICTAALGLADGKVPTFALSAAVTCHRHDNWCRLFMPGCTAPVAMTFPETPAEEGPPGSQLLYACSVFEVTIHHRAVCNM